MRCKVVCTSVELTTYGTNVKFSPVSSNQSEEDKAFWKATPSGEIMFRVVNDAAVKDLKPGQKYYVDFTAAE